ncbi:hypothetical protein POTOM_000495 [Populus tomentosa]|uniref:NAB domain-containing protein n=1 Tax=Populus tomentosa TaxID=118781 RepID=A0A8X8DG73_POPTO|nr:hypothetical protein POTOM_000495 [Populus tomentosa]
MEEQFSDDFSASFSWWSARDKRPYQSQRLQATLSDDGDSFAERAEMFYKRRPEVMNPVHDLHKSYRSLAESNVGNTKSEAPTSRPDSFAEEKYSFGQENESIDHKMESLEKEKLGDALRLQVSELTGDSLQQQSELIKRNDEKKEVIKHLSAQINRLME